MNIAFHTNQICLQGTEVALFDYAHFSEKILGHKAIVISRDNRIRVAGGAGKNQPLALEKFRARFPLFLYKDVNEIDAIVKREKIDVFYAQKYGTRDGVESKIAKTVIHTVFKVHDPHGDVYSYISKWLSDLMTSGQAPFVPYMVNLPKIQGDLRDELHIPKDALVFGRYGGTDSFNIPFVYDGILECVENDPSAHFIFMNTDDFLNPTRSLMGKIKAKFNRQTHSQIHFLPGNSSLQRKSQFINTCDAMLHARLRGETFGLAVAEFSIHNCPVITFSGAGVDGYEANHLEILGDKCFVYSKREDLMRILNEFKSHKKLLHAKNWDAYSAEFGPAPVMQKFKEVFL